MGRPLEPLVILQFRLRFPDLFWTYFGTTGSKVVMGVGLFYLVLGVMPGSVARTAQLTWGTLGLVGGPIVLPMLIMIWTGGAFILYRRIELRVDDQGLDGWPLTSLAVPSWSRLDRVRVHRGTIVLEFLPRAGRRNWIAIPKRAIPVADRQEFRRLFLVHASFDPFPDLPGDGLVGGEQSTWVDGPK